MRREYERSGYNEFWEEFAVFKTDARQHDHSGGLGLIAEAGARCPVFVGPDIDRRRYSAQMGADGTLGKMRKQIGMPEPAHWSIAVHRNNVRTNNAAVIETSYTSIDQLPEQSADFSGSDMKADEWDDADVWVDQTQMIQGIVGCQGIKINKVLSSWLTISLPPIPPAFTSNSHVFLIRFSNGKYAAVQLENYMNAAGTKCWLTINYRYPY